MPQEPVIDVSKLIDERKVTAFNIHLVVVSFFVVLFDGYDIGAASFAGPALIKAWNLADRSALAPVLAASLWGMLLGAPLIGYIGDQFGRRKAVIASCLIFGAFTWIAAWSRSLDDLWYLRFAAGIGIGGLLPNIIALNAEYAPRRFRATLIILMFTGVTFGGSLPGAVPAWLVPYYGWPLLFGIGGIMPIVGAAACARLLPESIKYLVLKKGREADVARLVTAMQPDLAVGAGTRFVLQAEKQYGGFMPKHLFKDGLTLITVLLWMLFALNLMGFYFLSSWTPTLLTSANVPAENAAIATAMFQIGGTVGGLTLSRTIDTRGLAPVTILFAVAVPVIASIGYVGAISETLLFAVMLLGGFCVLGLQFGLNATSAMIYPTAFRSLGSGWAFGIGRVGSIAGPYVGGWLIARHVPIGQLYLAAAIPFIVGTVLCYVLTRLYRARFQGYGLGQRDALEERAAIS